ncbi:hypothetical protein KKH23_04455, partial [Patescibacteria group bacterium]|nr:hypothetical protein [Patescibacteria group bacterium]
MSKILVLSEGQKTSKIALVGEAPGEVEERLGRPFVGPAGELLDDLLRKAGIARTECYITNVVKERPSGNDITKFISLKGRTAKVSPEGNNYILGLKRELSACSPNVIVALGAIPLYALTGLTGIVKRRGSILSYNETEARSIKLIPCIHPSAALREYLYRYPILNDLRCALEESKTPDLHLLQRNLRLRPSFNDAMSFLARCNAANEVALDIEVVGRTVSCISFALDPSDGISIPLVAEQGEYFDPEQEAKLWREIAKLINNPDIKKINQNILFDFQFLHEQYGISPHNYGDTMIAHKILWPDFPANLGFITSVYTREPYYKDEGKLWKRISGSYESFWLYNAKDSAVVIEAMPKLEKELQHFGNYETYLRQLKLVEPLAFMQRHGIKVDTKAQAETRAEAELALNKLKLEFLLLCGKELNTNSNKQMMDYFYEGKGITPYIARKTGNPTIDAEALQRLARRGITEAQKLLDIRKLEKLLGTYLTMKLDDDDRLRSSFNPVGTTTGRVSSSQTIFGTGGNMQNLPKSFRRFLVADDDYVIYELDLEQADIRVCAYIAPEPKMIEIFETGQDIHAITAGVIFGIKPTEVSRVPGSCTLGNGDGSQRDWGKKANHAFDYGFGPSSFAVKYGVSEAEGRHIRSSFHSLFSAIEGSFWPWVREQLKQNRTLTTPYGRKRLFLDRWDDELFRQAYAFIPQSTVGDHINFTGLIPIYYEQDKFGPAILMDQVHDSVAFEVPLSIGWEAHARMLLELKERMQRPLYWRASSFSIPAECKMGYNLRDLKKVNWNDNPTVELLAKELAKVAKQDVEKPKLL